MTDPRRIGAFALRLGLVGRQDLDRALAEVERRRVEGRTSDLGRVLVEQGVLTEDQLRQVTREAATDPGSSTVAHTLDDDSLPPTLTPDGAGRPAGASPPPAFAALTDPVEIGRGGMGEVYEASDPELGRRVAVKVIGGRMAATAAGRERFLREARITGQLEHPNIPPVHSVERHADGRLSFSMKRIHGRSLAAILADSPPGRPRLDLLRAFVKVTDALAYAHSQGVVHRDLKPENVMIGRFGEVQVMDWGIAKVLGSAPEETIDRVVDPGDAARTLDGMILGTPAYMSPEQAGGRSDAVGVASDVYSLGAVLYEILTLRPPYIGPSATDVLDQVLGGRPADPSERLPEVPRELEAVVLRAMARRPRDRYRSAEDLGADVVAWLEGRTLRAVAYGPAEIAFKWLRRQRAVSAALGVALLLLAALPPVLTWRGHVERRRAAEAAVAEAASALEGAPDPASLAVEIREETPAEVARRERALDAYLIAVEALDRALALDGDDGDLRARRRAAGVGLARVALAGGDLTLARRSFLALAEHGVDRAELDGFLAEVEAARDRVAHRRAGRLRSMLEDLEAGLGRPDRDPAAPLLEDLVFEASAYRDRQTVEILGAALERLGDRVRRHGPAFPWSEPERTLATFCCRVLGRVGAVEPSAVEPLAAWLALLEDRDLIREAAVALCITGQGAARPALDALRERFGNVSPLWLSLERWTRRLAPEVDVAPTTADGLFDRASAFWERGDLDSAIEDWSRVLDLDPGRAKAWCRRAGALLNLGRFEEAERDATRAIELGHVEGHVLQTRGLARSALGDPVGALSDLDRVVAGQPEDAVALNNRGGIRAEAGDLDGALADFTAALDIDPDFASAHNGFGHTLLLMGDLDGALVRVEQALRLEPDLVEARLNRGVLRFRLGDPVGALADLDLAIERRPGHRDAYLQRAQVRRQTGDPVGALADYDQAIEIDPDNALAHSNRGYARQVAGDVEGAIADFDRAIELDRGLAMAWYNRAMLRQERGQLQVALADFRAAVEADPELWPAWANQGALLHELGRPDEALDSFRRARDCAPAEQREPIDRWIEAIEGR